MNVDVCVCALVQRKPLNFGVRSYTYISSRVLAISSRDVIKPSQLFLSPFCHSRQTLPIRVHQCDVVTKTIGAHLFIIYMFVICIRRAGSTKMEKLKLPLHRKNHNPVRMLHSMLQSSKIVIFLKWYHIALNFHRPNYCLVPCSVTYRTMPVVAIMPANRVVQHRLFRW